MFLHGMSNDTQPVYRTAMILVIRLAHPEGAAGQDNATVPDAHTVILFSYGIDTGGSRG